MRLPWDFMPSEIEGYRWSEQKSKYGGIKQRWLVVESEVRRKSDLRRLEKNLDKSEKEANKQLRNLCQQKFACQPDAIEAAKRLSQKLKYHNLAAIQTTELFSIPSKILSKCRKSQPDYLSN